MLYRSTLAYLAALSSLVAQAPPAGFESVDHEVRIGTRHAQLRFDIEEFVVRPGAKVALTLTNTDAMQHNLLILRPGDDVSKKVGMLALQMGEKAADAHFVPDTPDVLFHTKAVLPGQTDTIWFTAPTRKGAYPYLCTLPGHMFTMRGVMHVGDPPPAAAPVLANVGFRLYEGRWKKLPVFADLKPARVGKLPGGLFDLAPLNVEDDFGAEFFGKLKIDTAGRYTFFLNSDDGSRLFVGGKQVAEYDGLHGMAGDRKGEVELEPGMHDIRVEYFQGRGGLGLQVAYQGTHSPRVELAKKPKPRGSKAIPLMVMHEPVVSRVHIEGGTGRSIAVGLPHGMNYCFDAEACEVRFGWAGAYLDVGPDRTGRGGQPCKILGERFETGANGFPLRTASGQRVPAKFGGYRIGTEPRFQIEWGDDTVHWSIGAAGGGIGLRYRFEVPNRREPLRFVLGPDALMESEAGPVENGVLTIPGASASKFEVVVRPKNGAPK